MDILIPFFLSSLVSVIIDSYDIMLPTFVLSWYIYNNPFYLLVT